MNLFMTNFNKNEHQNNYFKSSSNHTFTKSNQHSSLEWANIEAKLGFDWSGVAFFAMLTNYSSGKPHPRSHTKHLRQRSKKVTRTWLKHATFRYEGRRATVAQSKSHKIFLAHWRLPYRYHHFESFFEICSRWKQEILNICSSFTPSFSIYFKLVQISIASWFKVNKIN